MQIDYPYRVDSLGRTARTSEDEHIRDLIEQVLFTSPGERVNRPDFGSGLMQLVFAPNSDALAEALQFTAQAALQRWLGELIQLESLLVTNEDAALQVTVRYVIRRSRQPRMAQFTRQV